MDSKMESARSSIDDSGDLDLSEKELLGNLNGISRSGRLAISSTRVSWRRGFFHGLCISLVAIIGMAIYIFLPQITKKGPTGREFGDCGKSIEEARAKGCIFDNLSYSWVRPECHHPDLLAAYRNRTVIPYYTDRTLTEESRIPQEEIFRGDILTAWAPALQHSMHCSFMMSKIHLAHINHMPIDNVAKEFDHTHHCTEVLLDSWLGEMPVCHSATGCISKVNAKFTTCGYI